MIFRSSKSPHSLHPFRLAAAGIALASLLGLTSCSKTSLPAPNNGLITTAPQGTTQWVVSWGASPESANASESNPGGSEQSFRLIVLPTIDGTQERLHFSNLMGKTPVTIGAAQVAVAVDAGPAIDTTREAPLTFNGATSVTLAAGQEVVSDSVNVSYKIGEKLAVSIYLKGTFGPLTGHDSQVQTNFATATGAGNAVADATGAAFPNTNTSWCMLTGIDVYGQYQGTVAIFGSSSVDGHNSNFGDTNSYPTANVAIPSQDNDRPSDWLGRQLVAAGYRMGVLNAGALGDPAGEDANTMAGSVPAGVDRMNHDVLQQAGIKTVIIYFGGIDLRQDCKPATDVETSLTNMVQQAHAAGVRVILATLPPSEYCLSASADLLPSTANPFQGDINPGPENPGSTQRRALNTWIKTTGAQLPGVVAVADFDAALLDSAHPDFMIPMYNSGDNFHPNGAGYGVQSSAIPLQSILAQ